MTAAELLRDLVEALPKTEFWTPKLHKAEKAAQEFLSPKTGERVKKIVAATQTLRHPK
jgi:hypothetical protein